MKKCPQCGQLFSGDNVFCVSDGATMIAQVDHAAGESDSVQTQVFQRTPSQSIAGDNKTKWLYLAIGVLATALIGLGAILYVNSGKKETETANLNASKNEFKTVASENANQAKNSVAPVNAPVNNASSLPIQSNMRPAPRGSWSGDWTSPSGAYLTIDINLNDDGAGNVQGQIEWALRRTNRPDKINKIGMTAIEYVRGRYDPATGNLTISGYRKDDPNGVLVMVDDYRLNLTADGQGLNGAARNGGKWDGKIKTHRN